MLGLGAVVQFDLDVVQVDDDPVDDGADELSLLGAVHVLVQDVEGLEYAMELLEIERCASRRSALSQAVPGGVLTLLDTVLDVQPAWLAGYPYTRVPALTP